MAAREAEQDGAFLVLEEHLRREHARLEERRRDLDNARELIGRVTSRSLGAHETSGEPLSAASAPSVVDRLLSESTGMVRNFVLTVDTGPALDEATMRANRSRIERGDDQRAVYPADVLTTAAGQRWLAMWSETGEDQRILPTTGTEFAVFGDSAVIALAGWDDLEAGYVVFRDPLVVRLYSAYFDLAWKYGVPAPSDENDGSSDPRLVELLELGLKDEAIARHLGVSLRTVRRRVARLMSVNGVDTRFQLGWVLASRRS
ncbi:helix-turn-helix domain-containing protein [Phycicoccus sp. BSK3Z-2]|uniref:Helix-turn-helix domain-containing protein n=1 Tax=Phycicoccus avicenniae TaxID=2828860 RepID=A0A941DAR1_9MICO|nr:helix-turn-helix domain-containing protein [Phycicoccus avicenniae]MBR7744661.1 helix-turn-helix domain-containing protein [Phycicoccus avicenniae]